MLSPGFLARLLRLWVILLIAGSFLPGGAKRSLGTRAPASHAGTSRHFIYHVASFGGAALLASLAHSRRYRRFSYCAALAGLGLGIELGQAAGFGSPVEWEDVRDDACGIILFLSLGEIGLVRQALVREHPVE